jgi:hypothetical protein
MGLLFVLTIAFPSVWCIISTIRAVLRARQKKFWATFALLLIAGAVLGWVFAHWEYHAGTNVRVSGFPIPLTFFRLENGHWTADSALPNYIAQPAFYTNILAGIALLFLPLRFFVRTKS